MSQTGIHTVADLIAESARTAPDAAALIGEEGAVLSYRALKEEVSALAAQMVEAAPSGDGRPRIGIVLPNGLDLSVTLLAATIAGEATPFNPGLTAAEFERYFAETRISALALSESDEGPAATIASAMGLPLLRLTSARKIADAGGGPVSAPEPHDIALVLMTSGSTGVPKVVPLSHRNICRSAMDVARSVALGPQDRCLVMWQQFHIGGLVDLLLAPLLAGGALIVTRGFNEVRFFDWLEHFQPTWFQGVPTTLGALVQRAERYGLVPHCKSLRFVRSVAAALTPRLQDRLSDVFGVPVVRTLGMTEASPLITSTALPPAVDKPGSVGRPCGPEVRVFGPGMEVLGVGQTGEIAIRGENVFSGYENNPEANASAFRDGWFFTGDNGYFDSDGDLFLTGRVKEQINRGGYKIMPSEVEEALSRHPAVHEAAVFGLSHPTLGEDIAAAVSLNAGTDVDAGGLRAYLSGMLAANKVPSRISILAELPRNPVGKLDRLALAQRAEAEIDAGATRAGPRDEMERFLVSLWSRELALTEVGIDQDFMMLGGDSLSALRILLAMESIFGRPMPDDLIENLNTVAEVALALKEGGYHLPEEESGDAEGSAERALEQTRVGTESLYGADAFNRALLSASKKTDVEAAFEGLIAYETPATVYSVLVDADAAVLGRDAPKPFRFLMRRRFRHNSDRITKEINSAGPAALGWVREDLNFDTLHYAAPSHPARNKTLIVGFTGKMMRLQLPTYRFLIHLDPARFDLLLLRDSSQRLFANGVPYIGDSLIKLGAWLDDFATNGGYGRRIAFGTSGGGLAAIHTALAYGWDRVVAASPPSPMIHAELGRALRDLAAQPIPDTTEVVISHTRNARDIGPAQEILSLFPDARHDYHEGLGSHNVLNAAHRSGLLGALFGNWFD